MGSSSNQGREETGGKQLSWPQPTRPARDPKDARGGCFSKSEPQCLRHGDVQAQVSGGPRNNCPCGFWFVGHLQSILGTAQRNLPCEFSTQSPCSLRELHTETCCQVALPHTQWLGPLLVPTDPIAAISPSTITVSETQQWVQLPGSGTHGSRPHAACLSRGW